MGDTTSNVNGHGPWTDNVVRPITPRQVMSGVVGGFDEALALMVLADDLAIAYVNRFLTEYRRRSGHLPYQFQSRIERELVEPTEVGDWDLKVALAAGYGLSDEAFDQLLAESDDWDLNIRMGAVTWDPEMDVEHRPVMLGDERTSVSPESGKQSARWDVVFISQHCRILVRSDKDGATLSVRCEWPDHDGKYALVLRFLGGTEIRIDVVIVRGVWRKAGILNPDGALPIYCALSRV